MKKILLILVSSIFFIGCGPCENRNTVSETQSNGGSIELLIPYRETPPGVSIITLKDGRKFIYAESAKGGVAILGLNDITNNTE